MNLAISLEIFIQRAFFDKFWKGIKNCDTFLKKLKRGGQHWNFRGQGVVWKKSKSRLVPKDLICKILILCCNIENNLIWYFWSKWEKKGFVWMLNLKDNWLLDFENHWIDFRLYIIDSIEGKNMSYEMWNLYLIYNLTFKNKVLKSEIWICLYLWKYSSEWHYSDIFWENKKLWYFFKKIEKGRRALKF